MTSFTPRVDGNAEHDSTLFQPNELTLKQGEEFAHAFIVEQIKCVEAKVLTIEQSKESFHSIFRGLRKEHISKGRRKKENRRKLNETEKKLFEINVQRVHSICVINGLPKCLLYALCSTVPSLIKTVWLFSSQTC